MAGAELPRRSSTGIGAGSGLGFNAAISLLTIGVSNTMTAGAAIAVLGPIVLKTAVVAKVDPIIAGFVAAISSAFGYLTPAAQPAFTIIYASGYLKGGDFFKIGIKMMLVSIVILLLSPAFTGRSSITSFSSRTHGVPTRRLRASNASSKVFFTGPSA